MTATKVRRRLPVGAEVLPEGGVHFRVWAPRRRTVEVIIEPGGAVVTLEPDGEGYFSALTTEARAGSLYRFRLDGDDSYLYPDPASRYQPDGPHGPSQVVDPSAFRWADGGWKGVRLRGQVIYEMHVGTFTREGSWAAAARELPELAALGVTVVEPMPVADLPGRFGWGYDGVSMFAPTRLYGRPDDFRRFVDEAHRAGLAVILDVVYNHFGPDGNYLRQFAEEYFSTRHATEWGEAINFDGPGSRGVREFFISNAAYWIEEFHLDGFRFDATQQIFDDSPEHILAALARRAREAAAGREIILVAENEPQHTRLARPPERGGYGLDALWNDDYHHSAGVAMTGRNEAYYTDYTGRPQEFVSAVKYGYLYQGQRYKWQRQRRGTPALDLRPEQFVVFIQNHDQVSNSARGERPQMLTSPGRYRAMTALTLLAPATPMLFQGQEFGASAPFHYFADHNPDLAQLVRKGRAEFLAQFRSIGTRATFDALPDPSDPDTFERCKLDFSERERNRGVYQMHKDLLRLRREDPAFSAQRPRGVDGAVLGPEAFLLRFFAEDGQEDRLLLVNLGPDLYLNPAPEPLLAAPEGRVWAVLWSSEDYAYGGGGTSPLETRNNWYVPGHAAVAMRPARADEVKDYAGYSGEETEEHETRKEALDRLKDE